MFLLEGRDTVHEVCMQGRILNGEKYRNGLKGGVKISPAVGGVGKGGTDFPPHL